MILRDQGAPAPSLASLPESPEPIRAELFSAERLEQHAESIARQRILARDQPGRSLSPRVRDSGRVLLQCYRAIAAVIREEGAITPAAEWFVDNFHLVDEVVREVREDLPQGFYRQLPKLAEDPLQGYPRVLGLAWAFVAHTDSRFEPETLQRFVRGFQRVQPLTIGELWAVPIGLRVVLVENLRRLAERIVTGRAARHGADALASELLGLGGQPVRPLAFQELEATALPTAFTVQLVQRLREQDPEATPALAWLTQKLSALGTSPDELVRVEHQNQAAMNVTVRNVITSMRMMATFDWAEFFESVSLVDEAFRADSHFGAMDFATRDQYRHAIEELARGSTRSELDVTHQAMARAKRAAEAARQSGAPPGDRSEDPGYYLISKGRRRFEQELDYRVPLKAWLLRAYGAGATPRYLGSIGILTGLVLAPPLLDAHASGLSPVALVLLGLAALIPACDLAVALVNRTVTEVLGPRLLPRLELRDGIPPGLRTLVVVPTLLTSEAEIERQIDRLEIHYLANPDGDLRFALVPDWMDAPAETMPEDDRLLATAIEGIARLNRRNGPAPDDGQRFLLLHRRRAWNDGEGMWMGWERKRGKLHELNRVLQGARDTTFTAPPGQPPAVPTAVRYVITLDADTRLPRGAATRLVGTMAHPLNRPEFDPQVGRVVEGYAVLQPRVTPTMPTDRDGSPFRRIFAGPAGIDPYAAAISDVYQDLFGEGSYTGKGIYEVEAFEAALAGRVPENSLLSHDLFEGIFARAGLVTDIEVFEEFPSRYEVAAARQHRWARGDWQLLPWLLRGHAAAETHRTRIPVVGLWKMIDNLRRTLSAPAAWLTLVAAWSLPHTSPLRWTAFVLAVIALPSLVSALTEVIPRRSGISKRTHVRAVGRSFAVAATQIALGVTFLAHQAWLMSDAIARTLVRLYLTRRRLLEWTTAAQATAELSLDVTGVYRRMRGALVLAVAGAALVAMVRPGSWAVAAPFIMLWGLSPLVARLVSQPRRVDATRRLLPQDVRILRATARRTWRFFEAFVGADDHFLPPDNFQEDPQPVLAHRTSPTNIGLSLLATVAARDLGWLGTLETVERLEATLGTMGALERFRGHFYNWYDTPGDWAARLRQLAVQAETLVDIARALTAERGDSAPSDVLVWAQAARAAIASHERDLETIMPWAPLLEAALVALSKTSPDAVRAIEPLLTRSGTPAELAQRCDAAVVELRTLREVQGRDQPIGQGELARIDETIESLERSSVASRTLVRRLSAVARVTKELFDAMQFGFLFDPARKIFSIGYRGADGGLDPSGYDLLASEARLASFIAIAKGDVPASHWFHLGRPMTPVAFDSALVSWSGSMFEYLMPALVMDFPPGSLLEQTYRLVVRRQIRYGAERGVPWGISESAYNVRDLDLTFQYSNFGVAGLGLERGSGPDPPSIRPGEPTDFATSSRT